MTGRVPWPWSERTQRLIELHAAPMDERDGVLRWATTPAALDLLVDRA